MQKINQFLLVVLLVSSISLVIVCNVSDVNQRQEVGYKPRIAGVHKQLEPFVVEYIKLLEDAGIKLPFGKDLLIIDFTSSLPFRVLGVAWGMNIDNITFIQINRNYWNHLNKQQRRLLMFHELSHDVFNLEHFDVELMNTPIPDEYLITDAYVNKVMKELIKHLKEKI